MKILTLYSRQVDVLLYILQNRISQIQGNITMFLHIVDLALPFFWTTLDCRGSFMDHSRLASACLPRHQVWGRWYQISIVHQIDMETSICYEESREYVLNVQI